MAWEAWRISLLRWFARSTTVTHPIVLVAAAGNQSINQSLFESDTEVHKQHNKTHLHSHTYSHTVSCKRTEHEMHIKLDNHFANLLQVENNSSRNLNLQLNKTVNSRSSSRESNALITGLYTELCVGVDPYTCRHSSRRRQLHAMHSAPVDVHSRRRRRWMKSFIDSEGPCRPDERRPAK